MLSVKEGKGKKLVVERGNIKTRFLLVQAHPGMPGRGNPRVLQGTPMKVSHEQRSRVMHSLHLILPPPPQPYKGL